MQLLNKLQPLLGSSDLFKDPNSNDNQQGGKGNNNKWNKKNKRNNKQSRVKLGQGGTLDPLADGVLVIGTHKATKQLAKFLDCTKEYKAIGLLGCSTDSYDSDGKRVRTTAWEHVTEESIRQTLDQFRGEIMQMPPVFSALKMDGKKLCDYAREGVPLPRPIEARKQIVHNLELLSFTPGDQHTYEWPRESLEQDAKLELERLEKMVKDGKTEVPTEQEVEQNPIVESTGQEASLNPAEAARPPIFELTMTVSSGTYVRSIIHDLAIALGTSAHVVKLTRTRQGQFALKDAQSIQVAESGASKAEAQTAAIESLNKAGEEKDAQAEPSALAAQPAPRECVEWDVFEKAIKAFERRGQSELMTEGKDEETLQEWEREILRTCEEVN
ncbi:pseudouridine synthase pus4 [Microbotryomycetes sp. JL221]|nr:pseudouridine synthase pus4 [Microbotryomycetes sp. JL221]